MSITRREICKLLPALLPIAQGLPAMAAQNDALPSAAFEFDKLPVDAHDHAEFRHIMKGKLVGGGRLREKQIRGSPFSKHIMAKGRAVNSEHAQSLTLNQRVDRTCRARAGVQMIRPTNHLKR